MDEFSIIEKFFNTKTNANANVTLGIGDDAAIVRIPSDQELVITTDSIVCGTHFYPTTPAELVGHNAMAVNLSDLAAMGATPAWVLLSITLPEIDIRWLEQFSQGFFQLANRYALPLIGGDTTKGPLAITLTAGGLVPQDQALRRSTAKPGDLIFVTGTLGEAAFALRTKQIKRAEPRIEVGEKLRGVASAAIDISDGFAADLAHIMQQSGVGARIDLEQFPLSQALLQLPREQALSLALTGGDDYELCFTVPPDKQALLPQTSCLITQVGEITTAPELTFHSKQGHTYHGKRKGFKHFKDN